MSNTQNYHGWIINLVPESTNYSFLCCLPEKNIVVTDGLSYSTDQKALRAAWLRADLEAVKLCLTNFLHGSRARLVLTPTELTSLEKSIAQVVNSACNYS